MPRTHRNGEAMTPMLSHPVRSIVALFIAPLAIGTFLANSAVAADTQEVKPTDVVVTVPVAGIDLPIVKTQVTAPVITPTDVKAPALTPTATSAPSVASPAAVTAPVITAPSKSNTSSAPAPVVQAPTIAAPTAETVGTSAAPVLAPVVPSNPITVESVEPQAATTEPSAITAVDPQLAMPGASGPSTAWTYLVYGLLGAFVGGVIHRVLRRRTVTA